MHRSARWKKILDLEVQRWSALGWEDLASRLRELQAYEVEMDSRRYNVEVQLLEDTARYVHVLVAVDDGTLPWALFPSTHSFIVHKKAPDL